MEGENMKNTIGVMQSCILAYEQCCKPICRRLEMPQMAFDVLMFLSSNPEHSTAKDISRYQGFKETILSVNINKLVTEGYLERSSVEEDRRKVKLVCTEKAQPIIEQGRKIQSAFFAAIRDGLTEEEDNIYSHCLHVIDQNAKKIQKSGIDLPEY